MKEASEVTIRCRTCRFAVTDKNSKTGLYCRKNPVGEYFNCCDTHFCYEWVEEV